jgi:hypothetical protein
MLLPSSKFISEHISKMNSMEALEFAGGQTPERSSSVPGLEMGAHHFHHCRRHFTFHHCSSIYSGKIKKLRHVFISHRVRRLVVITLSESYLLAKVQIRSSPRACSPNFPETQLQPWFTTHVLARASKLLILLHHPSLCVHLSHCINTPSLACFFNLFYSQHISLKR